MQTLEIDRPEMPDLQFVLLVIALCTSGLPQCNVPEALRASLFDRCWTLIHECPPPTKVEERVLDLREVTVDAMLETIRSVLGSGGIRTLTWEHSLGETIRTSAPDSRSAIEQLRLLYPPPTDVAGRGLGID